MITWTVAHQAPLSVGFSRQNIGVGCHLGLSLEKDQITVLGLELYNHPPR